jgi:hypothetical protein
VLPLGVECISRSKQLDPERLGHSFELRDNQVIVVAHQTFSVATAAVIPSPNSCVRMCRDEDELPESERGAEVVPLPCHVEYLPDR